MEELKKLILTNIQTVDKIKILEEELETENFTIDSIYIKEFEKETNTIIGVINIERSNGGNTFVGYKLSKYDLDEDITALAPSLEFTEILNLNKIS